MKNFLGIFTDDLYNSMRIVHDSTRYNVNSAPDQNIRVTISGLNLRLVILPDYAIKYNPLGCQLVIEPGVVVRILLLCAFGVCDTCWAWAGMLYRTTSMSGCSTEPSVQTLWLLVANTIKYNPLWCLLVVETGVMVCILLLYALVCVTNAEPEQACSTEPSVLTLWLLVASVLLSFLIEITMLKSPG